MKTQRILNVLYRCQLALHEMVEDIQCPCDHQTKEIKGIKADIRTLNFVMDYFKEKVSKHIMLEGYIVADEN